MPLPIEPDASKIRAIPAEHVRAVLEVKATLTTRHARAAVNKLATLAPFHEQLRHPFHTGIVFFELPAARDSKDALLRSLCPRPPVHGYAGGVVLHCEENSDMTGLISVLPPVVDMDPAAIAPDHPLVVDVDRANFYLDEQGNAVSRNQAGKPGSLLGEGHGMYR